MHRHIRHAARRLFRTRGIAAASIVTLALGLGATTAVFSLVRSVLLRPLPYPRSERLVTLSHTLIVGGELRADQSDATLLFYGRHNRTFTDLGGYQIVAAAVSADRGGDAERVAAARVTVQLFPALGVPPLDGRVFAAADDRPGAAPVVVVGERLWSRKYGRDPQIVQRTMTIDGVPHQVVGIMPASFRFPAADTELWIPMRLDPSHTESATFDFQAVARLRDGISIAAAAADLDALLPRLPDEFPGRMTRASIAQTRMHPLVRPLADFIRGDAGRMLWLLFGAAALVLGVASANAANLLLVRAESRQLAIAIQRALGATARAVLAEFVIEGLIVAAIAGMLGVVAAVATVNAVRALGGMIDLPRLHEVTVDPVVIAVALAMSFCAALVLSVVPAWRYGSASLPLTPGAAAHTATATRERHRLRHVLIAVQVALSLMLVVGAGLLARSVWRLRSVEPGFQPANAITFRVALPAAAYPDNAAAGRFYTNAIDAIARLPRVRAAAAVSKLPLDERGRTDSAVFIEDRPLAAGALPGIHPLVYASPGYFAATGIPFAAGRAFTPADPPNTSLEAVVSRAFAERYWPGASALGRRVRTFQRGPWFTIVGIVGNVHDAGLDRPADQMIYCPLVPPAQDPRWAPRDLAMLVRTDGDPSIAAAMLRDAIRRVDATVPIYRVAPLPDIVSHAYARRSFTLVLIGCAAAAAILLAAVGLYGVIAFVVTLRTREIGIRLALGASPRAVRALVWKQGFGVAAAGAVVGLAGAGVMSRVLAAMLFEVRATDRLVFAASTLFLLSVAAAASWIPARRAAAIDPAEALRTE